MRAHATLVVRRIPRGATRARTDRSRDLCPTPRHSVRRRSDRERPSGCRARRAPSRHGTSIRPRTGRRRPFVPAHADENVLAAVVVDVAEADAVAVAGRAEDAPRGGRSPCRVLRELPGDERVLRFQLLITISGTLSPSMSWRNGPSFSLGFVSASRCRRQVWPFVRPSAPGFSYQVQIGRHERSGDDVHPAVAVHVPREIAVALHVAVPVLDLAERPRREVRRGVPVPSRDDVELAVAIDVGHRAPFVRVDGEETDREFHGSARRTVARPVGAATGGGEQDEGGDDKKWPGDFYVCRKSQRTAFVCVISAIYLTRAGRRRPMATELPIDGARRTSRT